MTSNMQRLSDTLSGRMKRTADAAVPTSIELGIINANLSLSTDTMKDIPKGEYMVNISLAASTYRTSKDTHTHDNGAHSGHTDGSGTHTHNGGEHDHRLPDDFRALKAGDRVLVAWCGNEPVVLAIVKSS